MRTLLNYWQYSVEALRLKRTTGRENLATGVARLLPRTWIHPRLAQPIERSELLNLIGARHALICQHSVVLP
jgi:hypothetical protein